MLIEANSRNNKLGYIIPAFWFTYEVKACHPAFIANLILLNIDFGFLEVVGAGRDFFSVVENVLGEGCGTAVFKLFNVTDSSVEFAIFFRFSL